MCIEIPCYINPKLLQFCNDIQTQVYLVEERKQIVDEALKDFAERRHTTSLAVALYFQLGLRVGELVVDHTKTDAGQRNVYLTGKAKKYLNMILDCNKENGYKDGDYLLSDENGRIHELTINSHIRRYCNLLGMPIKSSHEIRKTYISNLIDSGLNINKVRALAGHESELTTYNSYCYSRLSDKQTEDLLEKTSCI